MSPRWAAIAAAALLTAQLTACSKTVVWEEEVPLNTGEVIWVKRTVDYEYQGGAGNPFDMAYRSNFNELIEFTWGGKKYAYQGDARIMLLAISPQQRPVLVARGDDSRWGWANGYRCTVPYYVQLMPDAAGTAWNWPPDIEPWLFGLKHNLLLSRYTPDKMSKRYTADERNGNDASGSRQDPSKQFIQPDYAVGTNDCKPKDPTP